MNVHLRGAAAAAAALFAVGAMPGAAVAAPVNTSVDDPATTTSPDATATWYDASNTLCVNLRHDSIDAMAEAGVMKPNGSLAPARDIDADGERVCNSFPNIVENYATRLQLCFTDDVETYTCTYTPVVT